MRSYVSEYPEQQGYRLESIPCPITLRCWARSCAMQQEDKAYIVPMLNTRSRQSQRQERISKKKIYSRSRTFRYHITGALRTQEIFSLHCLYRLRFTDAQKLRKENLFHSTAARWWSETLLKAAMLTLRRFTLRNFLFKGIFPPQVSAAQQAV
jgi:hypothetical protein